MLLRGSSGSIRTFVLCRLRRRSWPYATGGARSFTAIGTDGLRPEEMSDPLANGAGICRLVDSCQCVVGCLRSDSFAPVLDERTSISRGEFRVCLDPQEVRSGPEHRHGTMPGSAK